MNSPSSSPRWKLQNLLVGSFLWLTPGLAFAQDSAAAEALFQEGRALLEQGKTEEACPKLAESLRLDSQASGTLLALAICHERQGKIASAWAEYLDVLGRARRDGRQDREQAARDGAESLRPKLSYLTIRPKHPIAGLEIQRDGVSLGEGAWNVAVPVDPGQHWVSATAPGKVAWKQAIQIAQDPTSVAVEVPDLPNAPPLPPPAPTPTSKGHLTNLQWSGIALGGVGALSMGFAAGFLGDALSKRDQSAGNCSKDLCGSLGASLRRDALRSGDIASVLAIAGGALIATGVTLVWVGRKPHGHQSRLTAQPQWGGATLVLEMTHW